ncbi:hypothetical protein KZI27_10615 [Curtobacterium sp. TC1]|uniref:hypothetical protein n=1 Tax=Curtobacterium sp. TC1 TaxID=2862880 RepID=UPI001C9B89A7|nr:hypothetical protein [Curtobacterium sp. TC1]QZQ53820.1 hypothetical protein KZI27_10615 [Curtobacterium sp. TC1]
MNAAPDENPSHSNDAHVRQHLNSGEFDFEMPPGFADGPAAGMSNVVYWWLSMALLVTPQQVQDQRLWQMSVRILADETADGFDEDRWDILEDWLARAFKDISAGLPSTMANPVRAAARLRTLDAIEAARHAVMHSAEVAAESASDEERGPFTSLYWALDGWALFTSQYARPAGDRHPEVLRSAANAAAELTPLRRTTPISHNIDGLLTSLAFPRSNPKRADGRRSACRDPSPLTDGMY